MVDPVVKSIEHLVLLVDFAVEVLTCILELCVDCADLIQVAVLVADLLLLHLDKLLVVSLLQVNDVLIGQKWRLVLVLAMEGSFVRLRWIAEVSLTSGFRDDLVNSSHAILNPVNRWLRILLNIEHLLPTRLQQVSRAGSATDEDFLPIHLFLVQQQRFVELYPTPEALEDQLQLTDPILQSVVEFRRRFAISDRFRALGHHFKDVHCVILSCLGFLWPAIYYRAGLLPVALPLFLLNPLVWEVFLLISFASFRGELIDVVKPA